MRILYPVFLTFGKKPGIRKKHGFYHYEMDLYKYLRIYKYLELNKYLIWSAKNVSTECRRQELHAHKIHIIQDRHLKFGRHDC